MSPLLELENIDVFYDDIQVLWNVSLKVEENDVACLLGPNGSGKTTLLRTILGLLHPSKGSIKLSNTRIDRLRPYEIVEAGICYIPEGRRLFPDLTVLENLEVGALTKKSKQLKDENFRWVFSLFPVLHERKSQLVGTLSGGEMQMLAVARGLMGAPRLLMVDEPSLGLGPKVLKEIFEVIKEINQRGVTVLLVEQNVYQALKLCHRAWMLETGRIIGEGTSETLLHDDYVKKAYLGD